MDWWLAGSVRAVRIALDILLYGGKTIVHHRVGTRRYFELTKRVLPSELMKVCAPHGSQEIIWIGMYSVAPESWPGRHEGYC